jgi:hypothetical protein
MSERNDLAEVLRKSRWDAQESPDYEACGFDSDLFAADAILAAGWRPPIHVHEPEVLDVSKNPSFRNSSITLCRECREILEWK